MRKTLGAAIVFLAALVVGFFLFVSGAQKEESSLQKRVDKLRAIQEMPPRETTRVKRPPAADLRQALQGAIRSSGIEVKDINRISERTEISTDSDPAVVARFAEDVSSGPLLATTISGEAWPLSVVIIIPKYTLVQ